MTQRNPEFGRTFDDAARVAAALGLREDDIRATGLPGAAGVVRQCRSCSCRSPRRAAVDRAAPDARLLDFEAYVFTTDRAGATDSATTYSGCSRPTLGIFEDPATGSASGPLGCYLVQHSLVTPEQARSILNLQGVKLGRPSWIHISIESSDGAISRVRVGGTSVFVAEGTMEVED